MVIEATSKARLIQKACAAGFQLSFDCDTNEDTVAHVTVIIDVESQTPMKVAVVGSGVSGLSATWVCTCILSNQAYS